MSRETKVSAITCLLPRGSPADRAVSAATVNMACAATACATGSNAVRYAIVSGAGRIVTRRSASARIDAATTLAASMR